jgi:hypothetical protein
MAQIRFKSSVFVVWSVVRERSSMSVPKLFVAVVRFVVEKSVSVHAEALRLRLW